MPLIEIKNETAPTMALKCAVCGATTDVALATVQLGAPGNPNQITLPPCPKCGSQELLLRTFDGEDDKHAGHRKAVNAVAIYLKGAGRVHPAVAPAVAAETKAPSLTRPLFGAV
jgi:hypothetical protein